MTIDGCFMSMNQDPLIWMYKIIIWQVIATFVAYFNLFRHGLYTVQTFNNFWNALMYKELKAASRTRLFIFFRNPFMNEKKPYTYIYIYIYIYLTLRNILLTFYEAILIISIKSCQYWNHNYPIYVFFFKLFLLLLF